MLGIGSSIFGQVGIGTPHPHNSAILDLTASDKGFLPPRLTTNQRDSISVVTAGLTIYNLDLNCMQYWNTAKWVGDCSTTPIGGIIATLDCPGANHIGTLSDGTNATGVFSEISYTGGNGGAHNGQEAPSYGQVTGLTATLLPGSFDSGNGTLIYTITGIPSNPGIASFDINIGGIQCRIDRAVGGGLVPPNPDLNSACNGLAVPVSDGSGTVNGLPLNITLSRNNVVNSRDVRIGCGLSSKGIGESFFIGPQEGGKVWGELTIKFDRPVSNLRVTNTAVHKALSGVSADWHGVKLYRNGIEVTNSTILQLTSLGNCNNTFYWGTSYAGKTLFYSGTQSGANQGASAEYNIGGVWFDEIKILSTNDGAGSYFDFCIGSAQ